MFKVQHFNNATCQIHLSSGSPVKGAICSIGNFKKSTKHAEILHNKQLLTLDVILNKINEQRDEKMNNPVHQRISIQ